MRLREHTLIDFVKNDHVDRFIYAIPFSTLTKVKSIVIESDRALMTVLADQTRSARCEGLRVLALPDKWYAIEPYVHQLPFEVIRIERVLAVRRSRSGKEIVQFIDATGTSRTAKADLVITNLGKRPNSELFLNKWPYDEEGYLVGNRVSNKMNRGFYVAGDVGHKAFQRISIAIGDGARTSLDYLYRREDLYSNRTQRAIPP
jgi:hypothetical protein